MNCLDVKLSLCSVLDWTYLKLQVLCKKKFFGFFFLQSNKISIHIYIHVLFLTYVSVEFISEFRHLDLTNKHMWECSPADGGEFMQRSRQCHDHLIRQWWKQKSLSDTLQNNRHFIKSWIFPYFPKETWHFLDLL